MTNFDVKLIDFIHKYSTFWFKKKSAVPASTAIILVSKRF